MIPSLAASLFSFATFVAASPVHKRAFSISPDRPLPNGPWPWPNKKLSYCYAEQNSYNMLHTYVEDAVNRWNSTPGGLGGLTLELLNPQICAAVPSVTPLKIVYKKDAADTTLGYLGPGRVHRLNYDPNPATGTDADPAGTIAHELGHALGLEHEHQRPDASQSIAFDCFNLFDWTDFAVDHDMDELCKDRAQSLSVGFSAADYIPFASSDQGLVTEGPVDFDSIMIYGSAIGAILGKSVLQRKDGNNLVDYPNPQHPSAGDASRLRNLYSNPSDVKSLTLLFGPSSAYNPAFIVDDFPRFRTHPTQLQMGGQCTINMTQTQLIQHVPGPMTDQGYTVNATLYDANGTAWDRVTQRPVSDTNQLKMQGPMPAQLIIAPQTAGDVRFSWGSESWDSSDKDKCTLGDWGEADGGSDEARSVVCKFGC